VVAQSGVTSITDREVAGPNPAAGETLCSSVVRALTLLHSLVPHLK